MHDVVTSPALGRLTLTLADAIGESKLFLSTLSDLSHHLILLLLQQP